MAASEHEASFSPGIPFEEARIFAGAIYCSDGRFGSHCDEFLEKGLGLPRYDRLIVPGGPAALAGHFAAYRQEEALLDQMGFLLRVHHLKRIILIAHESCAFYLTLLGVSPAELEQMQQEDLRKAAKRLQGLGSRLQVETWFARRRGTLVRFEHQPVEAAT